MDKINAKWIYKTDKGLKVLLGEIERLKELVKNGELVTGGQQ